MKPNVGINHLAKVIDGRVKNNMNASSDLVLDFGDIQGDYSLLTHTFPKPIPKSDYLVCRQLTLGNTGAVLAGLSIDGQALIPPKMRWLMPGDKVLVAWIQNDAVIIDIVLPANIIG